MLGVSLGIPGAGDVGPGTHVCALHVGPAERDRLLFPFLDAGLHHGDKVLCLTDDLEPSQVRDRALGRPGSAHTLSAQTFSGHTFSGQLVVQRATDVYLRAGTFDVAAVTEVLVDSVEAAVAADFTLLRTAREMSWALARPDGGADLLLHESAVNRVVEHLPALVMCFYDLTTFGADLLVDVLRTHAQVLIDGVMVDNPYFADPSAPRPADPGDAAARRRNAQPDDGAGDRWESLTHAELRVASQVARGTTNRCIAADLQVSRHTVDAHLKHIYLKLQIHSRVELTVLVLRHRLTVD